MLCNCLLVQTDAGGKHNDYNIKTCAMIMLSSDTAFAKLQNPAGRHMHVK